MNNSVSIRRMAMALSISGSLMIGSISGAATVYDADFSTLTAAPAGWVANSPSNNLAGWKLKDAGYGYVRDTTGQTNGGVSSYNGTLTGGASPASLDNYVLDSVFWKSSNAASNFTGLAARVQNADNYYTAFLNSANQLFIRKVALGNNTDLSVVNFTGGSYANDEKWRLTFSVAGNQLEAKVYDTAGNLRGTASAVDSTYSTGTFGLRVQTGAPGHGLFKSLTASTIDPPAPAELVASPASGFVFDLGDLQPDESKKLSEVITLSNAGGGTITRTGASFSNNPDLLFDIQGFSREGTAITPENPHTYDVFFRGTDVLGLYETTATIKTTEGDITYTIRANVIPEPSSAVTLLGGLGLLVLRTRRRRNGASH